MTLAASTGDPQEEDMDPESEKPLRLFVNPFTIWTQLALKTQEAMWAAAHAAAVRANAPRVAVIPTADAPAPKTQVSASESGPAAAKPAEAMLASAHAAALRNAKVAAIPAADGPPRKAKAAVRQASKAARFKATRAKLRSKANAKRRARR
jgi:hypothetical protein